MIFDNCFWLFHCEQRVYACLMRKNQRTGLHVSAAGGVENAPENAQQFGAECFQFFSRSPRGGPAPSISDKQASLFKQRCNQYGFESYIHTPYYINFCSAQKHLAAAAPRIVREELVRGSQLGVKYVVTHLGSAKDYDGDTKSALKQVASGLKEIYRGQPDLSTQLLLEISAGSGAVVGNSFEELGFLLKELDRSDVHICLDTCHMFASGYDLRTASAINATMKEFRRHIGISHFKLLHINDSMTELDSHKDRHEHLGRGKIGEDGLKSILQHPDFQKINLILETKHDGLLKDDLQFLKKNRKY